jgi:hypothetical protein
MRNSLFASILVLGLFAVSPLRAQTASGPDQALPNLSGIWEVPNDLAVKGRPGDICGEGSCRALLGLPPLGQSQARFFQTLEEPQMLPWAEEQFKKLQATRNPNGNPAQELNPAWGGCVPEGPTELMRGGAFELRQFPDAVLLFFNNDHAVRRVYLDGRGHPANGKPTPVGHSVGKYEGDTLVIDTVGISDKTWIDPQGRPHTDALRLTERIRRVDQETLEIVMTIDDPKTYVKPWRKRIVHLLRPPGPNVWDNTECDELLRMGTHYSAEAPK